MMLKLSRIDTNSKEKAGPTKFVISESIAVEEATEYIPIHVGGPSSGHNSAHTINELGRQLLKAAAEGSAHEIRWLLSKGASFTADWLGTSPLHLASTNNHLEVCKLLLRAGISRDARTKVDKTPLHMAAYEGHNEIVELLLHSGVDSNAKDLLGMTALHWAVQNGHIDVVATLIRHGAQTDISNKFDLTPLDIAVQTNRHDIIELVSVGITDPSNATESLAVELGCIDNNENTDSGGKSEPQQTEYLKDQETISMPENIPLETVLLEEMDQQGDTEEYPTSQTGSHMESEEASMDESFPQISEQVESFSESMKLLQQHGITMLPADDSNILASVVESGHSVVLTDVGREILNNVKLQEQSEQAKVIQKAPETKKVITLTPEEFISFTNGTLTKGNLLARLNKKIVPKTIKRIVMKKNKTIPVSSLTSSAIQNQNILSDNSDMQTVMTQLIEARKTIEEYKTKIEKMEEEVERYKQQIKLLMDSS